MGDGISCCPDGLGPNRPQEERREQSDRTAGGAAGAKSDSVGSHGHRGQAAGRRSGMHCAAGQSGNKFSKRSFFQNDLNFYTD